MRNETNSMKETETSTATTQNNNSAMSVDTSENNH